MDQHQALKRDAAADTGAHVSAYVPPLQRTAGQPPPIAANGGLSYMSFDRDGDAGTAAAIEDALAEIAEGEGQRVIDMIDNAPPGPIETKWGLGFRDYDECMEYIRASNIEAPEGGVALPLPYTVYERPTYSVVPSNALWRDPARADVAQRIAQERAGQPAAQPLFPAGAARRAAHRRVLPGSLAQQPRMHGPARRRRWRTASPSARTSTTRRRWSACSTRRSRSCCSSSSRARPMRWSTTTTSSTRTTRATARRTRTARTRA